MVGAVIVKNDQPIGEGWHVEYGADHAEMSALARAGENAKGATLYVTLEPCNHVGRTPPCAPVIVDSGIARVIFAADDPNPVARGGAGTLRRGGLGVESGLFAGEAMDLNAAFHSRFSRERPFVTLKLAVSIDGGIANPSAGVSRITGKAAERMVHHMRAGHDAIAVGSGTAITDDPQLTVRGVRRPRVAPLRIVFDRRARLPLTSKLVKTAVKQPTLIVTAPGAEGAAALRDAGAETLEAPTLHDSLRALRSRGIDSVLVEGGGTLAGALLADGVVDRLVIFQAPLVLGPGAVRAFAFQGEAAALVASWRIVEQVQLESDVMTTYAPQR
jgi:diaminohydroxyphosphoribosylaminopyrimidine deaminase/5-amino-6-(5-phosphoribosylamino)uracil reductase